MLVLAEDPGGDRRSLPGSVGAAERRWMEDIADGTVC
jgi:hypothetical protein